MCLLAVSVSSLEIHLFRSSDHFLISLFIFLKLKMKLPETESESRSVVSVSLPPHGLYSPWNSPGQNTGVGSLSLLQGIFPNQGSKPRSPTLQVYSLPAEPQGKPKNTGVSNLSLLQGIFLTQESNWGLLYCRRILYPLRYQGSPLNFLSCFYILEINPLSLASFAIARTWKQPRCPSTDELIKEL